MAGLILELHGKQRPGPFYLLAQDAQRFVPRML